MAAFKDIIDSDTPVLVDFFAEWCGPCKMMPPILKEVKSTLGDQVKVLKIDVDKNKKVVSNYQIQGVPTLILFKGGKVIWRKSGVIPATELVEQVKAIP